MSLAVLEGMATGLPAIGSKTLHAIVATGKNGFIVDEGPEEDQVNEYRRLLLETPEAAWEAMGAEARRTVLERFSWERIADETCKVYVKATQREKRGNSSGQL